MGNDFPKPSKVRNDEVLLELKRITLDKLRECIYLWKTEYSNSAVVYLNEFEDIFGHLIKDADLHFNTFKHDNVVSIMEYLVVTVLLSKSSVTTLVDKIEYVVLMVCDSVEAITRQTMVEIFQVVLVGFSRIFDVYRPTTLDIELYIDKSGMSFTQVCTVVTNAEENLSYQETREGVSFDKIWMWFQDRKLISQYLDALISLNAIPDHIYIQHSMAAHAQQLAAAPGDNAAQNDEINDIQTLKQISVNIKKEKDKFKMKTNDGNILSFWKRRQHPLWSTFVTNMARSDEWYKALPEVSTDECVFSGIEHMLLGDRQALCLFQPVATEGSSTAALLSKLEEKASAASLVIEVPDARTDAVANVQLGTPDPRRGQRKTRNNFSVIPDKAGRPDAPEELAKGQDTGGNADFVAIIDSVDILGWIAACVPSSVSNPMSISKLVEAAASTVVLESDEDGSDELKISKAKAMARRSTINKSNAIQAPLVTNMLLTGGGRNRRVSSNSQQGALKVWHECGTKICLAPMHYLWNPKECGGFNDGSPMYTSKQIVQIGNSIYDVIYWFAKGYRNVPIAAIEASPYKVTHVVTGYDLIEFLISHNHILGQLYRLPLKRTRLVKRAITVKSSMNLGTAIQVLGKYNVDTAVILDDQKKVCGRFSANIVQELYWQWRLSESIRKGKMIVLGDCKAAYKQGGSSPGLFNIGNIASDLRNGTNLNVFNNFSALSHPLKLCEGLGVGMKTIQEHVEHGGSGVKKAAAGGLGGAFAEEEEEDESSSSSDSSSDSDSDSNSDSDSDSDKKKKKKSPPPKKVQPKGSSAGGKRPATLPKAPPPPTAKELADAEEEAMRHAAVHRVRKMAAWFRDMGAIQLTDNVASALEAMAYHKSTRAFIVSQEGDLIGVVSLMSICHELLRLESELRTNEMTKLEKENRNMR